MEEREECRDKEGEELRGRRMDGLNSWEKERGKLEGETERNIDKGEWKGEKTVKKRSEREKNGGME